MKKYLLFTFILIALKSLSQPTLNISDFTVSIEENYDYNYGLYVSPGSSGADINWNFSVVSAVSPYVLQVLEVPNTPYAADYPDASFAIYDQIDQAHRFYMLVNNGNNQSLMLSGDAGPGGNVVYTDAQQLLDFPFTYNDEFTDTYAGSYLWSGTNYIVERNGTVTVEADAYGTLTMPYGTINDVLRVKYTSEYEDYNEFAQTTTTISFITYKWYKQGNKIPILEINTGLINGATQYNPYTRYMSEESALSNKIIDSEKIQFAVYPNPSNGVFEIKSFDFSQVTNTSLQVLNISGKVIHNQVLTDFSHTLDLSDYPKGMYFVQLESEDFIETQKIIIE